jgi:hypothetical protein
MFKTANSKAPNAQELSHNCFGHLRIGARRGGQALELVWNLVLGAWCLFEIWCLELGASDM